MTNISYKKILKKILSFGIPTKRSKEIHFIYIYLNASQVLVMLSIYSLFHLSDYLYLTRTSLTLWCI